MFTTGNTHLKYRKHHVHSAAHKLKIRSSRLVLTTAGTDLDSTDRAAMWGAKNSSASEPLKRPILSLWNSRVTTGWLKSLAYSLLTSWLAKEPGVFFTDKLAG